MWTAGHQAFDPYPCITALTNKSPKSFVLTKLCCSMLFLSPELVPALFFHTPGPFEWGWFPENLPRFQGSGEQGLVVIICPDIWYIYIYTYHIYIWYIYIYTYHIYIYMIYIYISYIHIYDTYIYIYIIYICIHMIYIYIYDMIW